MTLKLLLELEPARRAFFGNLIACLRRTPPRVDSLVAAQFWPDVFVAKGLPWFGFLESILWHAVVFAALWVSSQLWLARPQLITKAALNRPEVVYYSPSEYLQPIDTGTSRRSKAQRGEPEFARQPIISVPAESDNQTQTIVTPPDLKLKQEIAVANIVAWDQPLPMAPLSAAAPSQRNLSEPQLAVVAPAPTMNQATSRRITAPDNSVITPSPEVRGISARAVTGPLVAVVAPPPSVQGQMRKAGDITIGPGVVAPAPQLPMPEQRASVATALGVASGSPVPPAPSLSGVDRLSTRRIHEMVGGASAVPPAPLVKSIDSSGGGRLIALGIHPAVLAPPSKIEGKRRGTFAASPEGRLGAQGSPEISASSSPGVTSHGANGKGHGEGYGSGVDPAPGIPAGIHVGAGPSDPNASSAPGTPGATLSKTTSAAQAVLSADSRPMRVTVTPRPTSSANAPLKDAERRVFGDRKSYSMILNMPNLNSVGGSWIIRFAQRTPSDENSELTAPTATRKVDPGYPTELMRQNVEGDVVVYAIIRSDGTVGDVSVLSSADERLDPFAQAALAHWKFNPATRNGSAVDLDAVVTIPFRARRSF